MNNSTQLIIADITIKQDAEGRYCLNDLHKAFNGTARQKPTYFMREFSTVDLLMALLDRPEMQHIEFVEYGETIEDDTYACVQVVWVYAMWLSPIFGCNVIEAIAENKGRNNG